MTKKEKTRFEELEAKARNSYLEYSDFNPYDYLETDEEKDEYLDLLNKLVF